MNEMVVKKKTVANAPPMMDSLGTHGLSTSKTAAFLDYLLRPDIAARNTRVTNFASGVLAAQSLTAKEIAENKAIYPDKETMKRLFTVTGFDQPTQKFVTSQWTQIKTGR